MSRMQQRSVDASIGVEIVPNFTRYSLSGSRHSLLHGNATEMQKYVVRFTVDLRRCTNLIAIPTMPMMPDDK